MQEDQSQILSRLARLEAQNRHLRCAGLVAVLSLGLALTAGAKSEQSPPTSVEAQRFVVKDKEGATKLVLESANGGGRISLRGPSGNEQITLEFAEDGPVLDVRGDNGSRLLAMVSAAGPRLFLLGTKGGLFAAGMTKNYPYLTLGRERQMFFHMGPPGKRLTMVQRLERAAVAECRLDAESLTLWKRPSSTPEVKIVEVSGKVVWSAP